MSTLLPKLMMVAIALCWVAVVATALWCWNVWTDVPGLAEEGWHFSLGGLILATALLTSAGWWMFLRQQLKTSQKTAIRSTWKQEQAQISAEKAGDYVKALEAKVQTLETALSQALKRQQTPTN